MKKFNKKSLALLICTALLLTFTVSGTVAYLMADTDPVENVFTPATVDTEIEEPGWEDGNDTKDTVVIHNSSNIKVFVRVAIIANWYDDEGNIVKPWTGSFTPGNGWTKADDGFYYYNPALEPDDQVEGAGKDQTSDLLGTSISGENTDAAYDGLHLEVVVIHQSIQAEGMGASSAQEAFAKAAQ